jgi:hypothetical protein
LNAQIGRKFIQSGEARKQAFGGLSNWATIQTPGGVVVTLRKPPTSNRAPKNDRDFGTPRSTVEEGALAILKLASSAEVEGRSGLYFNGQEEARADAQAYDPQARQRLKRLSFELTGL